MLKTVFIGSRNDFDQVIVHWLAQRTDLRGVVWTSSTEWQHTWRGRLAFARRRARRYGPLKVLDEAAFYLLYHRLWLRRDHTELRRQVIEPYDGRRRDPRWSGAALSAESVNAPEVLDFVRACDPDFAVAMCVSDFFGEELRAIPRHGVFLWHEGITPEYRGLYSPFWAIHDGRPDLVGYTLLRMTDRLDAGEVYVQGRARDIDPRRHGHLYLGHKAIWDSLPEVERFLAALEAGEARPIERADARSCYYTYPGLSDHLRLHRRLHRSAA